jgi:hypothetical protein
VRLGYRTQEYGKPQGPHSEQFVQAEPSTGRHNLFRRIDTDTSGLPKYPPYRRAGAPRYTVDFAGLSSGLSVSIQVQGEDQRHYGDRSPEVTNKRDPASAIHFRMNPIKPEECGGDRSD